MIVKLKPSLKSYLWGGTKLKTDWNKKSDAATLSEAWELSFHPDGPSLVDGGEWDGRPLREVALRQTWGERCGGLPFFPVLTKFIDAAQPLSVQVHPTDEYALAHEGQYGKSELWYILAAQEGAFLYLGMKRDTSSEEFAEALKRNTVCNLLNRVPVKAGETYFIPAGTVHAVGAGITLFEVQQNSDLTYRVYDYDRTDAQGKKRELHVEKAAQVVDRKRLVLPSPERGELLGACKYFTVQRRSGGSMVGSEDSFASVTVLNGRARVGGLELQKGETAFLSAGETARAEGRADYLVVGAGDPRADA